jgi:hypothetical protein
MELFENNTQKELFELAQKKMLRLKGFYIHTFIYIIGVLVFVAKTYFGIQFNFFPVKFINWFVMSIWTTAYLISALSIFFEYSLFGKKWEEKKINEFMKNKNTWE